MPFDKLILALPKGRILRELKPILRRVGIEPEPAFEDDDSRLLRFATNIPGLDVIRVRSFDVATYVAFGAAQLAVVGSDVLAEFDYAEVYAPVDLRIGRCRLSVAEPSELVGTSDPHSRSHIRVATKYPHLATSHFARRGVQAECVRLTGAIELAPVLGLTRCIVDLISTGSTAKANGLVESEVIAHVSSRLAVNRTAWKTRPGEVGYWIRRFQKVVDAVAA